MVFGSAFLAYSFFFFSFLLYACVSISFVRVGGACINKQLAS